MAILPSSASWRRRETRLDHSRRRLSVRLPRIRLGPSASGAVCHFDEDYEIHHACEARPRFAGLEGVGCREVAVASMRWRECANSGFARVPLTVHHQILVEACWKTPNLFAYGQRQSLARDVLSHYFSLLPSTPCAVAKQTDAEKGTKHLHRSPTLMSFLFPLPSSHHTLLLPKSLTTPSPPPPSCLVFHIRPPSKTCPGHTHPHPSASVLAGNLDGRRSIRRPACGPPVSALGIFFGVQAFSASPIPHDARRIPSDVTPGARGPTQTTLTRQPRATFSQNLVVGDSLLLTTPVRGIDGACRRRNWPLGCRA